MKVNDDDNAHVPSPAAPMRRLDNEDKGWPMGGGDAEGDPEPVPAEEQQDTCVVYDQVGKLLNYLLVKSASPY